MFQVAMSNVESVPVFGTWALVNPIEPQKTSDKKSNLRQNPCFPNRINFVYQSPIEAYF